VADEEGEGTLGEAGRDAKYTCLAMRIPYIVYAEATQEADMHRTVEDREDYHGSASLLLFIFLACTFEKTLPIVPFRRNLS
jgi:hypothetical protein